MDDLKPIEMYMVDPVDNNNKFYRMTPMGDQFLAEWGRVGVKNPQKKKYSIGEWSKVKRKRERKGYVEQPSLSFEEVPHSPVDCPVTNELLNHLLHCSQQND